MFALKIGQLFFNPNNILIRSIRSAAWKPVNPGINKRLKAFQEDGINIEDENVDDYIEESASDFFEVGHNYSDHIEQLREKRENLKSNIVKRKYFKIKLPNLLTWSEKEQIRHLAASEPQLWTLQHIAESFPCTVYAAKRLIQSPWKPESEEAINRHDTNVMKNWRELKAGNIEIPTKYQEHFLKFSHRTVTPTKEKVHLNKVDLTQKRVIGEFERMVSKSVDNKTKTESNQLDTTNAKLSINISTNVLSTINKKRDTKVTTLDELTKNIKTRLDKGPNHVELSDKIIIDTVNIKNEGLLQNTNNNIDLIDKPQQVQDFYEKLKKIEIHPYKERIRIPKKAYKKGATYRVSDCYYDDDGKFLYRVLGMTAV